MDKRTLKKLLSEYITVDELGVNDQKVVNELINILANICTTDIETDPLTDDIQLKLDALSGALLNIVYELDDYQN
jgi:IMP cyclohydrolase